MGFRHHAGWLTTGIGGRTGFWKAQCGRAAPADGDWARPAPPINVISPATTVAIAATQHRTARTQPILSSRKRAASPSYRLFVKELANTRLMQGRWRWRQVRLM